ncbi:hypothetical protein [Alkalihalobacterium alkalicellulosilyticum]|uniref:hypothetical protein n=1 Tax=Alkalihalobacterium alkalicellulosilyticum TaxID=1912214 RepID=UPI003AF0A9CF
MLCLLIIIFVISVFPTSLQAKAGVGQISFLVKSSSYSLFESVLTIEVDSLVETLLEAKTVTKLEDVPFSNHYILINDDEFIQIFIMDEHGNIYNLQEKTMISVSKNDTNKIKTYFELLDSKHFGSLMSWDEVKDLIPRYSKFKITDLETGLSFKAQRRAGSSHADVQPLTENDTKIMKKIYNGKWSWKRRAILIHYKGQTIAASMHGMPHGGGAIQNRFPGHFCIHFKDCVTHRTKQRDLSHHIMIYKAAGLIKPFVEGLTADEVVEAFFISLNQQDYDLLKLIYQDATMSIVKNINHIRIVKKHHPLIDEPLQYEIPVTFIVQEKNGPEYEFSFDFIVTRTSPVDKWQLKDIPIEVIP